MCKSGKDRRINPRKDDVKQKHINARQKKKKKYDYENRNQED